MNTECDFCLTNTDVCSTVCNLDHWRSFGSSDLVPCKTQSKFFINYLSFLFCMMFSVWLNKTEQCSLLEAERHIGTHRCTQTETDIVTDTGRDLPRQPARRLRFRPIQQTGKMEDTGNAKWRVHSRLNNTKRMLLFSSIMKQRHIIGDSQFLIRLYYLCFYPPSFINILKNHFPESLCLYLFNLSFKIRVALPVMVTLSHILLDRDGYFRFILIEKLGMIGHQLLKTIVD